MRQPTPNILDAVLTADVAPDRAQLRNRLRYDYAAVPALHRKAVEDAAIDILANGQRMKESAVVVGERLLDVKQRLDHGQFSDWCSVEFDMSQRIAQHMMNVARQFGDKSETVSFLTDSVLYLLAAPSTPEAAREAVIEQVKATGQAPTRAAVKAVIDQHKPTRPEPQPTRTYASGLPKLEIPPLTVDGDRPLPAWVEGEPDAAEPLSAADLVVMQPAPEARPFDDRRARLAHYNGLFEAALNALPHWEELTGRYTATGEATRGLRKVLELTRRELAILRGEVVEAWGEEVAA